MVSTAASGGYDGSAMSKSRQPFRMPRNSPDDSKTKPAAQQSSTKLAWNSLGLLTEIVECLENELQLQSPTPVQSLVIPELLKEDKEKLLKLLDAAFASVADKKSSKDGPTFGELIKKGELPAWKEIKKEAK